MLLDRKDSGRPVVGLAVSPWRRQGVVARLAVRAALAIVSLASPVASQTGPIVTYAGAIPQDGCPGCCRFDCRLTPTPTPHVDQLGRQVFQRAAGRFLFVVEGGHGLSLRPPSVSGTRRGESIEPLGAFARPGLQVRFDRGIGNRSSFVECGTNQVGGVPAAVGLNETQLTNALIDAACRFEWVPAASACTRNRFGDFSTIDSDTITQFCFQVPESAEFADGDTVAQIQLRDTQGNLGPAHEIVIRVGTAAPTPTPTPTLSGSFSVAGSITHYRSGAPVVGVTVEEASGRSASSGVGGTYALHQLPAAPVAIEPRKNGSLGAGVSPLDAAFVLQSVAQMRSLDSRQRLACDATGNGTLTSLDATRILQLTVGLIDRLPVAEDLRCGSEWTFVPVPAAAAHQTVVQPSTEGGLCRAGAIHYDPLSTNASGQSFHAIPFGDCTGNWQSGSGATLSSSVGSSGAVRLGRARRQRSGRIEMPVYVDADAPSGVLLEVSYDQGTLAARRTRRGASPNALMVENRSKPGRLRLAVAGDIDGRAAIAILRFRVRPGQRVNEPAIRIVDAAVESE